MVLEKTDVTLENGGQYTIRANQSGLSYKSNNTDVAIVSKNGVINAIGVGTAVISVYNADYETARITVEVIPATTSVTTTSSTTTTTSTTTTSSSTSSTTTTTTTEPPVSDLKYGDIDGDDKISAYDASLVLTEYTLRSSGKTSILNKEQAKLADIDGDGKISAYDASLILGFYTYLAAKGEIKEIMVWVEMMTQPKSLTIPQ